MKATTKNSQEEQTVGIGNDPTTPSPSTDPIVQLNY